MPELPEVENIVKMLNKALKLQIINDVVVINPKIINGKSNLRQADLAASTSFVVHCKGKIIEDVVRFGKLIVFNFTSGDGLIAHLKMTGQFILHQNVNNESFENHIKHNVNSHTQIVFCLSNSIFLHYNDVRKFGFVNYFENTDNLSHYLPKNKIDPLLPSFTFSEFSEIASYKIEIKKIFLQQKLVLGIGNIYSDEICFASKISPLTKARELNNGKLKILFTSIKSILVEAVALKGSSVSDYLLPDGTKGGYQKVHKVYGRGGKNCICCGNILIKTRIDGRGTVYCGFCQS